MFGWFKKQPDPAPVTEWSAPEPPHEIDTADLAQLLLGEYVYTIVVELPPDRPLDPATRARYENTTKLYQLAGVLICLLTKEKTDPMFGTVRNHLEGTLFGFLPDGRPKLPRELVRVLESLSKDLRVPMRPGKSPGRWANAWLGEIGVGDWRWNPVDCDLVGLSWMNYCIMVSDALQRFKPVAPNRQ
jgi:hypothetical protein